MHRLLLSIDRRKDGASSAIVIVAAIWPAKSMFSPAIRMSPTV
jgi:hypothetical protein